MHAILEVEPEVASKIQARARERGVSVDAYLLELIEQETPESKSVNRLSSEERVLLLREWAAGHIVSTTALPENAIRRENIYGERG